MASGHIQALLEPPSAAGAHKRTRDYLGVRFRTFQDVQDSTDFDALVESTSRGNDELKDKVRNNDLCRCTLT